MKNLIFTFKAWPVIAMATIGLCFLTQTVATWLGIHLPDQANIEVVRHYLKSTFASPAAFVTAALLVAQVLIILPVLEEIVFRWLIVMLPTRRLKKINDFTAKMLVLVSALLFSAAHYIKQPWPDTAFVALFFFGLAQCWLYKKTDRLWCPILNHSLFNLTNLILLFLLPTP